MTLVSRQHISPPNLVTFSTQPSLSVEATRLSVHTDHCGQTNTKSSFKLMGDAFEDLYKFSHPACSYFHTHKRSCPPFEGGWLVVGCLTSQQHASVPQGRICSDNLTCCHTEIEVADQTFHLTQSQYTNTGPTSPSSDPITRGAWHGSHLSANF